MHFFLYALPKLASWIFEQLIPIKDDFENAFQPVA